LENKLWPEGLKEVAWADVKRRAATDPSWVWHHPRALDDVRDEMVKRDIWRDLGGGFYARGPFPKPPASVSVQFLSRDEATGRVKLRVRPLNATRVVMNEHGTATPYDNPVDLSNVVEVDSLEVSFLAIDDSGEHEPGDPYVWHNTIEIKHRFYQDNARLMCELRAIPTGEIRYTVDGSGPDTSGQAYAAPFEVPKGTKLVLARASADGTFSELGRFDVPVGPGPDIIVELGKPATWKRRFSQSQTGDTYTFLDVLEKHHAWTGGARLNVGREKHWVELQTDSATFQDPAKIRDQATLIRDILGTGNLTIDVESLQFARGQDLLDLVADLKTTLKPGEVEQPS
jgi:hypothetical protein